VSSSTQIEEDLRSVRAHAEDVFADFEVAEQWLNTPNALLGSRTPAEAISEGSLKEVDEILFRIDYGIFS
jgi:uncharacterized protein (DUF2384 family)